MGKTPIKKTLRLAEQNGTFWMFTGPGYVPRLFEAVIPYVGPGEYLGFIEAPKRQKGWFFLFVAEAL
jgi:hypothetical protein